MSDAIPSRPPLRPEEGWRPPSRDFFGGPPPVDMTDPANVPPVQSEHEFLYGDVPPEVVFTAGGAIAAPSQAHRYATFKPLLDRIGPGAASMVEREMDRARAFEVIARAAVEYIDDTTEKGLWDALVEAVAENRAAIQ
ncbi:hypothetical protein ABRQ22_17460 [Cellulosimicrobium sp. ES-005]|uniref:Uncharacterized protein n=1 Tax=Cellulosimicrobium sp. ES-005 TaxID=3163031 RepID=A0AAU8FZJ6_9MICO